MLDDNGDLVWRRRFVALCTELVKSVYTEHSGLFGFLRKFFLTARDTGNYVIVNVIVNGIVIIHHSFDTFD